MLVVTVEFLHGVVRASAGDDVALTGQDSAVEWPPSPARLYSAFVAADGTGDRCRVTSGPVGLDLLEAAPVVHAAAPDEVVTSQLVDRFVVIDKADVGSVQEYPARKAQPARPGARLSLRDRRVVYRWPDVDPDEEQLRSLRLRAARIGYLGCSDSPARVRVSADPPEVDGLATWEPDPAGDVALSVAFPGFLDELDRAFDAWAAGSPRRRSWIEPHLVTYRSPQASAATAAPVGPTIWLRFDRTVDARKVLAVAETLRAATLERFEAIAGGRDAVPEVLHGHHEPGIVGVEHARWLPLLHAGFRHADGRIRGACIWFPPGTAAELVDGVTQAVTDIDELVRPGVFSVRVAVFDGTRNPWATNPLRWIGPARRWVSVLPVIHERFTNGEPSLAELARWCTYAGLPAPTAARVSAAPLLPGVPSIPASFTVRAARRRRPFSHVELVFADEVTGPVALGHGRHFGFGLMAPVAGGTGDAS